jgi:hypothetical protein
LDEYGGAVTDLIGRDKLTFDQKLLSDTRNIMQNFFTRIKAEENHIKLAFIAGANKFSTAGVFTASTISEIFPFLRNPAFSWA